MGDSLVVKTFILWLRVQFLKVYGCSILRLHSDTESAQCNHVKVKCIEAKLLMWQERVSLEEKICSGRCKDVVRRIVEQVRAETEQWSQMQDMLAKVRSEMEELQNSRDFWEGQALTSDNEIHSLQASVSFRLHIWIILYVFTIVLLSDSCSNFYIVIAIRTRQIKCHVLIQCYTVQNVVSDLLQF